MGSWDSKGRDGILSWLKIVGDKHASDSLQFQEFVCLRFDSLGLIHRRTRIKFLENFRSTHRRVCRTIQVEIQIYFFEIGVLCYRYSGRWG
jgi:hypothetical protein